MSLDNSKLSTTQLATLRYQLPGDVQSIFQTNGGSKDTWRQLLAFNPTKTFVLSNLDQLGELKSFLQKNSDHLCAGYLSYDLGVALHKTASKHNYSGPLAMFHVYENWLDGDSDNIHIARPDKNFESLLTNLITPSESPSQKRQSLQFEQSELQPKYEQNIKKIHDYIRAGDIYQINYTQQLHAESPENPRSLYPQLIQQHPAEYACYLETSDLAVHSLSPELFLHYDNGKLTTKPIKGTRPRGSDTSEDDKRKQELLNSEKEQAELYMITDLLRNDLGQVSKIGSVELETLKGLNKLPKVWHTYSQISGNIARDVQPIDALLSMFPGGSITGCPKRRALEVIDELESSPRGIYTGSIGYFHPDGDFSFNIAIRTLVQQGTEFSLGSGGGITIDSNWRDEWDELMVKVSTFE